MNRETFSYESQGTLEAWEDFENGSKEWKVA
jgi:hypothetical protein